MCRLPRLIAATLLLVVLLTGCSHKPPVDYSRRGQRTGFNELAPKIPRTPPLGARRMLRQNGFVVLAQPEAWDLAQAYLHSGPGFITSDAVLYVFHSMFRAA